MFTTFKQAGMSGLGDFIVAKVEVRQMQKAIGKVLETAEGKTATKALAAVGKLGKNKVKATIPGKYKGVRKAIGWRRQTQIQLGSTGRQGWRRRGSESAEEEHYRPWPCTDGKAEGQAERIAGESCQQRQKPEVFKTSRYGHRRKQRALVVSGTDTRTTGTKCERVEDAKGGMDGEVEKAVLTLGHRSGTGAECHRRRGRSWLSWQVLRARSGRQFGFT